MKRVRAGEAVPPGRERVARVLGREGGSEREALEGEAGVEVVVLVEVARVREARRMVRGFKRDIFDG